jgi:hypothetical protein
MRIFQSKMRRRVTVSGNMTGNKKARHEAGLYDVCDADRINRLDDLGELASRADATSYLASLAICAVRRETLRLALFL